jgi:hypothetical protein
MSYLRNIYSSRYGDVTKESAYNADEELSFLGFGKKDKAKREQRRAQKDEQDLKKIRAKGEARALVAKSGGGLAGLGAGLSNIVSGIFGGKSEEPIVDTGAPITTPGGGSFPPAPTPEKGKNKMLIVGVVCVVVIVVVVLVIKSNKAKKAKSAA